MKITIDRSKLPVSLQVNSNLGTFGVIDELGDTNSIEYAARLYATACSTVDFDAALSSIMPPANPIDGKSPLTAAAELNRWWKNYRKVANTPATWYSDTLTKSPIVVTPSGFSVDNQVVPMPGGVPGLTPEKVNFRIAADILMLYTTCPATNKNDVVVTEVINPSSAETISFPRVNFFAERKAAEVGLNMGDTMIARDALAAKFASSTPGILNSFSVLHKLYSHPNSISGGSNEALTKFYNDNCNIIKKAPLSGPLKIYQKQTISVRYPSSIRDIWAFHVASLSVRGASKGRGGITVGYYRGDLPHHAIRNIDLASDMMMACKGYGLRTIEIPDEPEIIKILIANGYKVINARYGKEICQGQSGPGLYGSSSVSYVSFRIPTLEAISAPPKGEPLLPKPVQFPTHNIIGKQKYVYYVARDYIREGLPHQYPSISAAEGVCIRAAMKMNNLKEVEYASLMKRFAMACAYRNAFFMTRVMFSPLDPYRGYFPTFTIPKIKPDVSLLDFTEISQAEVPVEEIPYYSLITPVAMISPFEQEGSPIGELEQEWESFGDDLSRLAHWMWKGPDFLEFDILIETLKFTSKFPQSVKDFLIKQPPSVWERMGMIYPKRNGFKSDEFRSILEDMVKDFMASIPPEATPTSNVVSAGPEPDVSNVLSLLGADSSISTAELRVDTK